MSPHCFQQLPFSTFSLTFFCFDKGFCPSTTAAWEVSLAGWWPQPSQGAAWPPPPPHGISWLLRHRKSSVANPTFLLWPHCSFQHASHAACLPRCLCWAGAVRVGRRRRRPQRSGREEVEGCSHKNCPSPSKLGDFITHTRGQGKGEGSAVVLLFAALSGPIWFCCRRFFGALARSAASGFLFLDASVGACSFYIKQRKPVGILKLGAFSTKAGCIFFRSWWEISIHW